jgi:lysophospholipase L1-like esterase
MKRKRTLALVFGGGIFVAASYLSVIVMNSQHESLYLANPNYHLRVALFATYRTQHADIVMLGNSLTEWADWNELLGRTGIANRGIASDITYGYLQRMEYVYKLSPRICFIEGGINDLYANVPVVAVFENFVKIVEELRERSIIPVITSTLYTSTKWHSAVEKNKEVAELNARLLAYAQKQSVEFINLIPLMTSNNLLRDALTYDGLHLTAEGYKVWGREVEKTLLKYGL